MGLFGGGGLGGLLGAGAGFMLGGPAGAMIGGSLAGGVMDTMKTDAVKQGQFTPYNVEGPFGSMGFDAANRRINLGLSDQDQIFQNQMFRAMRGGPFGMSPEQSFLAQQGATLGQEALGLGSMSGLFGRGLGMQAAQAGSGFLNAANATDPTQIAGQQFDRMQALLSPRRERARLGLESRLLRQGLLGSTAGGEQFRAQNEANSMQDARMAESALREGLQTQQGLFGMGMQGLQQGAGLFNQATGTQLGAMTSGLGMLGMPVQQQQQALQNYMGLLGGRQQLQSGLLGMAQLGMGAGEAQAQIAAANAQRAQAADQANSDMLGGLITGGLGLLGGM